ncbi:MAG: hypothetical protein ACREJC_05255 [Tepidisphaeraceae bacterium]
MNKRQLIDDIRAHNSTARERFLTQFDEAALSAYLRRLESMTRKHVRISGWVRKHAKLRLAS